MAIELSRQQALQMVQRVHRAAKALEDSNHLNAALDLEEIRDVLLAKIEDDLLGGEDA